jgi:hypothetical protein
LERNRIRRKRERQLGGFEAWGEGRVSKVIFTLIRAKKIGRSYVKKGAKNRGGSRHINGFAGGVFLKEYPMNEGRRE